MDEHKPLEGTSAYETLTRRIDEMSSDHRRQLEMIERNNIQERSRMQLEIDKLRKEQADMKTASITQHKKATSIQNSYSLNADIYVRMNCEDFLDIDPPPPYTDKTLTWTGEFMRSAMALASFSLTPLIGFQEELWLALARLLRPRLQKDYSRIQWTCVSYSWSYPSQD